jgi:hypothetical protein
MKLSNIQRFLRLPVRARFGSGCLLWAGQRLVGAISRPPTQIDAARPTKPTTRLGIGETTGVVLITRSFPFPLLHHPAGSLLAAGFWDLHGHDMSGLT